MPPVYPFRPASAFPAEGVCALLAAVGRVSMNKGRMKNVKNILCIASPRHGLLNGKSDLSCLLATDSAYIIPRYGHYESVEVSLHLAPLVEQA
jgi:hypothetical protein